MFYLKFYKNEKLNSNSHRATENLTFVIKRLYNLRENYDECLLC